MSLLGFFLRWRETENGPICTHYIDAVSMNSKQNGRQVQSILSLVVPEVKTVVPGATSIILLSDNGPAFTSKDNMAYIFRCNQTKWSTDLFVKRWIFFEAQCGKTALDTHFSFVGIRIRRFARIVRPVKVHADVYDALTDGEGIANTTTMLVEFPEDGGEDTDEKDDDPKVQAIRKIHDIIFDESSVRPYYFCDVLIGPEAPTFSTEAQTKFPPANIARISRKLMPTVASSPVRFREKKDKLKFNSSTNRDVLDQILLFSTAERQVANFLTMIMRRKL
jgi:hypothetical protein